LKNKSYIWFPFLFAIILALGLLIGMKLNDPSVGQKNLFSFRANQFNKINDVINYVNQEYVDTVNQKTLTETTIEGMLHQLDPHSAYIPASELQAMNEPLEGNFEGIGIEFHIQEDTIMVVTALAGGPSDQLGIQSGDRIVKVDGKIAAGIHITNTQVTQMLRGPKGTKVNVSIFRSGNPKLIDFSITRGKIPIYSVDAGYMLQDKIGYIKVSHFAERTYEEYTNAFEKLKAEGMEKLILDLRGNPGGYLKTAIQLADEFLPDGKLIVYTEGRAHPKEIFKATTKGNFETGKLIVLIDEGSASASEIVSGALQDQDRALIVGRRSFGKGLVQEQSTFPDGSAIRLTIARYYTPTGRSIQKSYTGGYDQYQNELLERYKKGELISIDSIHFIDSLKFKTPEGRIVYGGGGIMPDVFVPLDTSGNSAFFNYVNAKGLVTQFAYDELDRNRNSFRKYKSFAEFNKHYTVTDADYQRFIEYAKKNGVSKDEKGEQVSAKNIRTQVKALMARQIWKNEGFYQVVQEIDETLARAIDLIEMPKMAEGRIK
jgi:carboxyl-terminal processing protease